jgi:nicotinamide mononucleotide (NMN) deamidase PncC
MNEGTLAERVISTLAGRGLTLGTVECGTAGVIGRTLFDTEDGPAVLGDSLNVDTVEEAIDFLGLPWQQFGKAGSFSAKAARAAARLGREAFEIDWCLAVWALPLPASAATVEETVFLALDTGTEMKDQAIVYDGPAAGMAEWLVNHAIELLRAALPEEP